MAHAGLPQGAGGHGGRVFISKSPVGFVLHHNTHNLVSPADKSEMPSHIIKAKSSQKSQSIVNTRQSFKKQASVATVATETIGQGYASKKCPIQIVQRPEAASAPIATSAQSSKFAWDSAAQSRAELELSLSGLFSKLGLA